MNLHTIELPGVLAIEPDEDTDEDNDGIHCVCGSSLWRRRQYGTYREDHVINLTTNWEDWDNRDDEFQEADSWECQTCGRIAPDNIADALSDF